MGVERLARRSFGFVVAALLGLAIYFQAAGAVELVAAKVLVVPAAGADGKARRTPRRSTSARIQSTNGDAILARNPFDSVTGPLDRTPIEVTTPEPTKAAVDLTDPLSAPECADVVVNIVSESPDPVWSLAQLKGPGDQEAATRRVGDEVGKLKVAYIGYNSVKASPAVWLVNEDHVCQALLWSEKNATASNAETPPPAPTSPPPEETPSRRRRGASSAPALPTEISEKIQKVSETEFNVDRSVIDNVLENQAQLMRSARIVPEQKDGKTVGIRLFGIRQDTLLGTLGMQNGDRLEKINGFDMASPEKALEAYARLRTATSLTVNLTRRGKPLTIEYQIK
ncbi:MAG TPA: type II secretion system protein GspC [Polyangiaceae bacterium]|nr:type II secretion system protein GspC [Polyangiaceae bacterium]